MFDAVPKSKVILRLGGYDLTYREPKKNRDRMFDRNNACEMAELMSWICDRMVLQTGDIAKLEIMLRLYLPPNSTQRTALYWVEDNWYLY